MIDLENFVRGWNEKAPKKGKVLFSAVVTEKPYFDQFQRAANSSVRDRFMGFFGLNNNGNNNSGGGGYDSDDDDYYIRHPTHQAKFGNGRRLFVSDFFSLEIYDWFCTVGYGMQLCVI